jgi:hypothetical protein
MLLFIITQFKVCVPANLRRGWFNGLINTSHVDLKYLVTPDFWYGLPLTHEHVVYRYNSIRVLLQAHTFIFWLYSHRITALSNVPEAIISECAFEAH